MQMSVPRMPPHPDKRLIDESEREALGNAEPEVPVLAHLEALVVEPHAREGLCAEHHRGRWHEIVEQELRQYPADSGRNGTAREVSPQWDAVRVDNQRVGVHEPDLWARV